jgi:hypothetical protein
MAAEIPDDLLHEFTAVARYDGLAGVMEKRFGGITDSITLDFPAGTPDGLMAELVKDLQAIPTPFRDYKTN